MTEFMVYEACDPGNVAPERRFVCLIALTHLGDVHAIHYGENYDDTLAKAQETWNKHVDHLTGKTVDRRRRRDPMVRLQLALDKLEAMLGDIG